MPLSGHHYYQWHEEHYGRVLGDYVSGHSQYSSDEGQGWVPTPAETISSGYNWKTNLIADWFNNWSGAPAIGSVTSWYDFIVTQKAWPSNKVYNFNLEDDDGPDGIPGTNDDNTLDDTWILGSDLKNGVYGHMESKYDAKYKYTTVHGTDPANPTNPDTASQANSVSNMHIYNTAIVTPYDTSPYVLEWWGSTDRVVNGAFIQLPDKVEYKETIPTKSYYNYDGGERYDAADNFFNYETRFGRGSTAAERPGVGLTFGADSSWREIGSANF